MIDNRKYEVFRTPQKVIDLLISDNNNFWKNAFIDNDMSTFLDPSAGDGRILKTVCKYFERHGFGEDIENMVNNDILPDKNLEYNKDYDILHQELVDKGKKFDLVISNPPFTKAESWVRKIHEVLNDDGYCIFLQRLNWAGTQKRSMFFKENDTIRLKYVLMLAKRPIWEIDGVENNKADTCEYAWFVFQKSKNADLPKMDWLYE